VQEECIVSDIIAAPTAGSHKQQLRVSALPTTATPLGDIPEQAFVSFSGNDRSYDKPALWSSRLPSFLGLSHD
jgi:hypothetical protein